MTLTAVFGIMVGLYLYEYTGFFSALRCDGAFVLTTNFDIKELLLLYFEEARVLALIFIFGFTLFSPYISVIIMSYKGFLCGFCILYFGMYYENGTLTSIYFALICAALILLLLIYIMTSAKAIAFSASLRWAAPDIIALAKQRQTRKYIITFLILAAFLAAVTAIKYCIPLIPL